MRISLILRAPILTDIPCAYSKYSSGQTGEKTSGKGKEGRRETVTAANEKRAEGRDKTRNNGTKKDNK